MWARRTLWNVHCFRPVRALQVRGERRNDGGGRTDKLDNAGAAVVWNPDISGAINGEAIETAKVTALVASGGRDGRARGTELAEGAIALVRHPNRAGAIDGDAEGRSQTTAGVAGGGGDGRAR